MDAFRESYDPDVIVRTDEAWPEQGPAGYCTGDVA